MAYFPIFYSLDKKEILVVGGGKIATEKLEKLVQFTKNITIISKELSKSCYQIIQEHRLTYYKRAYKIGDIEGFNIVVVATDDIKLQESIYKESRFKSILVNSVDNIDFCDFIFPSFVKRGDLTIAFSTSGASPAFAKQYRRKIEDTLPNDIEEFLTKLKEIRKTMPKGKERMEYLESLVSQYLN